MNVEGGVSLFRSQKPPRHSPKEFKQTAMKDSTWLVFS